MAVPGSSMGEFPISSGFRRIIVSLGLHDALSGRHLLLTGGTGFFGRWLLALLSLLNRQGVGITVTVLSRNPERFLAAQPVFCKYAWLQWLRGDVRELQNISIKPVDLIIHGAADTSVMGNAQPLELFDTIVNGSRRVLDLAVHSGCTRVLLTGSGAQYGSLPNSSGVLEGYTGACMSNAISSVYGEAKRAQETLGIIYAKNQGVDVVMTRCFSFSGAGLPLGGHFAIGNFVRDALFSSEVVLNSNGKAVRSYLHGADLAVWLLTLLVRGESGTAYNVGSDQAISIADLARRVIARLAPEKPLRILGQAEEASRSFYIPDISKAKALGLDVWTSLDESIDSMAGWVR